MRRERSALAAVSSFASPLRGKRPVIGTTDDRRATMAKRFKVGDKVRWNSEADHVSGMIIHVHAHDFDYKGHTHRASVASPQYEIKSSTTDHIAAHKGTALTKVSD